MAAGGRTGTSRLCYLGLLLVAAVVFYQHHTAMQREIQLNRRSRDQFEHLYEDVLKQESEWKGKYDKAQMQVAEIKEAMGEMRTKLAKLERGKIEDHLPINSKKVKVSSQGAHEELKHEAEVSEDLEPESQTGA